MGKDIGFAHNEIRNALDDIDYSPKHRSLVGINVKTHRTGYSFGYDEYEDYGALVWIDKDGVKKKKIGKKRIRWEYESYEPKDYVKRRKVLLEHGDYGIQVEYYFISNRFKMRVFRLKDVVYQGFEKCFVEDDKGRCIWEKIQKRQYAIHTEVIKEYVGEIPERNKLLEWIHAEFDTKFWGILEETTRVPKFKNQKGYEESYFVF